MTYGGKRLIYLWVVCMNDKLLMAFIKAQGYDVEEEYKIYVSGVYIRTQKEKEDDKPHNQFPVASVVDYKVTKKKHFVPLLVDSEAWGCIVEYLSNHEGDIEAGINDFDTLRPMWEFITRGSQ